ncbi:coagulation factor IXb [Trichomycterus rosablanca]|uniref:coagulation factor IXb n=1 Tax=Trichomycterus rosablanca TaxID=2290929 RepID=UPI002F3526F9
MDRIFVLVLFSLVFILISDLWIKTAVSVFVSREAAQSLLSRHKRYNTGGLEEMKAGNLERECIEERCNLEEAREVFENEERTMEFWAGYIDGDQCLSSPCQNGGKCTDAMSAYVCWCPIGFIGKNCEFEMARQCDVNNGGCQHFCYLDKIDGVQCDCANGYKLGMNRRSCEPFDEYPCGRLAQNIADVLASRTLISEETVNQIHSVEAANVTEQNFTLLNITNITNTTNTTTRSTTTNSTNITNTTSSSTSSTTTRPTSGDDYWAFFPTLPTVTEEKQERQRIVGGFEATPGEIPWQVALVQKGSDLAFCGGSLLSSTWVITAAHCLIEGGVGSFFVRVGEHNVKIKEEHQSDHDIEKHLIHHSYNYHHGHNHDIALLKLRTPVTFSDYVIPICLGPRLFTENALKKAPHSLVSGWGRVRYGGLVSDTLQKVEVPYVDRTECKGSDKISRFMFCAGYNTVHKDSCQGDSGGPHATKHEGTWFLTGIISWGDECAKEGKYGVYTRLSRYMNWITNVTGIRAGP